MQTIIVAIIAIAFVVHLPAARAQTADPLREWRDKRTRQPSKPGDGIELQTLVETSARLGARLGIEKAGKAAVSVPSPLAKLMARKHRGPLPAAAKPLNRQLQDWQITWNQRNATPFFITTTRPRPSAKVAVAASAAEQTLDFIHANRALFRLQNPGTELRALESIQDHLGNQHVVFQQWYQGIPVWGHELVAHLGPGGGLYAINARYSPTPRRLRSAAEINAEQAMHTAADHLSGTTPIQDLQEWTRQLLDYHGPIATRYIWVDLQTQQPHLVWHVQIRPNLRDRWYYFVDAHSGRILEHYNATNTDGAATARAVDLKGITRTLEVYEADGTFFMIDASRPIFGTEQPNILNNPLGALLTLDARQKDLRRDTGLFHIASPDNNWDDPVSVSAHSNTGQVFDYYFNTHGRRGIDDRGGTMISVIHVTNEGRPMDNAFWNGTLIAYGDGNRGLEPLAEALDVAAHEMTHGVIERTVNLEYRFQSGALNESFADVFGAMVDRDDWLLGEDVVRRSIFPSGALRNMEDPHNGGDSGDFFWQPAHMDEFVELDITRDNGGVHVNSGIPNRVCFLIAEAIGRDKTEQLYYRILAARYLNTRANFIDMRLAARRAAADLFGDPSPEVDAVGAAFDRVGIVGDEGMEAPADTLPVSGEQWIAVVNAESSDHSLYLVRPEVRSSEDIKQLTSTQVATRSGKPISVVDDGSVILFVDASHFIRAINSDGTDEKVISTRGIWNSIALSPDGRRLAATSVFEDTTIVIFELANLSASKPVRLYNPTTQEGVEANVTRLADVLDWDLSGRFIVYDAFNSVSQAGGVPISFWNVNILDVDNEIILPLFPAQPRDITIGNPSFSQTSNNFIVFDLIDSTQNTSDIWAVNLFTGDANLIESNGFSSGYPKFSPDDSHVVFQRLEENVPTLRQIPLAPDKIHAAGPSENYLGESQRPDWFAMGSRASQPTGVELEDQDSSALPTSYQLHQNFPNPFNSKTIIRYALPHDGSVSMAVYDLQGRRVAALESGFKKAGEYGMHWNGLDSTGRSVASGVYLYRLKATAPDGIQTRMSQKMTLLK